MSDVQTIGDGENRGVFDDEYRTPIHHRNAELDSLSRLLEPAQGDRPAKSALIHGPNGVEKTASTRWMLRDLCQHADVNSALAGALSTRDLVPVSVWVIGFVAGVQAAEAGLVRYRPAGDFGDHRSRRRRRAAGRRPTTGAIGFWLRSNSSCEYNPIIPELNQSVR
ncbi:hypothetical protein [Halosolutus gelatinilyticus]|uniref:hypothetical protein n=1 Tax=Halosolutus gelatinilyticus TaxID=2931975 RepID=UPI001FF0FC22|nr:hypothetical protein [Halosolutus gelatinilyticus]